MKSHRQSNRVFFCSDVSVNNLWFYFTLQLVIHTVTRLLVVTVMVQVYVMEIVQQDTAQRYHISVQVSVFGRKIFN